LFFCSLPKFDKVPKGQSNILHPKIIRKLRATLAQLFAQLLPQV